jgi:lipopolysaccharide transport system permease protein
MQTHDHGAVREQVIRPSRSSLNLNLGELWRYRELIGVLFWRDFTARFRQTVLGPAWYILTPLVTAVVFTIVFAGFAQVPTDGLPPLLFYQSGLLCWNYFSGVLGSASGTLTGNAGLFSKIYFPRLIPAISGALSALTGVGIQLVTFYCFYFYLRGSAGAGYGTIVQVALLPLLLLQTAVIGIGCGLILSSMTAKYRDLSHASGFLLQIWMYATPVIVPASRIPEKWQWLLHVNPVAPLVENFRIVLLGSGSFNAAATAVSVAASLLLFAAGLVMFNRTQRTFVDTV